jgi:hypothetical protein
MESSKVKRQVTTTETERFTLDTDEIEEILHSHFSKKGWDVDFDWNVGQWVSLDVKRSKSKTTVINPLP